VVVNDLLDGDPTRVTGMSCRFTSMVLMPNTLAIQAGWVDESIVSALVKSSSGELAVQQVAVTVN
jgi:hypothetical protein